MANSGTARGSVRSSGLPGFAADLCQYFDFEGHALVGYPFVKPLEGSHASSAVFRANKSGWITVDRQLPCMFRLERLCGSDTAYPLDGQPEVVGNLVVNPVRIPPVQNELLDDLVLDVFQFAGHSMEHAQEYRFTGSGLIVATYYTSVAPAVRNVPQTTDQTPDPFCWYHHLV